MSTAEQKIEIVKLLLEADDVTTNKVFQLLKDDKTEAPAFSDKELEKFHATRQKYINNEGTILLEDAHAYIRSLKQK